MKLLKTAALAVLLVMAGAGSATVLDVYGSITGTANVEAAAVIVSYDLPASEVDLEKNTDQDITSADDMEIVNATGGNGTVLADSIEMTSNTKTVEVSSFDGVQKIELEIGGKTVDTRDIE